MPEYPILDNHLHLQPDGLCEKAILDFQNAGGTHIILSHLPYHTVNITKGEDFLKEFDITLKIARQVREATDVKVFTTLGPYPVRLLNLEERYGLAKAVDIMKMGMELAARKVEEQEAVAIGEIGRPHFPVSEELWDASNEVMSYGMEMARDVGCPVVLHTESAGPEVWKELSGMADKVNLPREMVIKHYSPPIVREEDNHGLFPSILASRKAIKEALSHNTRFMMETDYLDDLRRPGAVMAPTTVPKRTKALIQNGDMDIEGALQIHKYWPEKLYGIEIEF